MSAPDPLPGVVIDGRWRIVERLAADEETTSYKVESLKGGKPVRLALLDARCAGSPQLAARFDREARALSRVDHPSCVSILGFGIDQGRPYLVTPLLVGRRLSEEIGAAPLAPGRAVRLACQLLEGLRHGHAHGVSHRELSPDKVLLVGAAPDHVKILDFGLARIAGGDEKRRGAPGYLAPEQLGNGAVDARADLFAVGAILRAMLSGRLQPADVALAVSPSLERAIARAQAALPEKRFADADEMLAALTATVEGRARRSEHTAGAPLRLTAILALLVALAGVGFWIHLRPQPPPIAASPPVAAGQVAAPPRAAAAPIAPAAQPVRAPPPPPPTTPLPLAAAPPSPPVPAPPLVAGDRQLEALLSQGRLEEAEAKLHALIAAHSDRAELHLELAEVYYRRFWRRDAVAEWDRALSLDPALAGDARITGRLCSILGPRWAGAGELIERHLGKKALPALVACAGSVNDLARLQAAAQLAERLGGPLDPQLVARRTLELTAPPD